MNRLEDEQHTREHCGTKTASAACNVKVRYIFSVPRGVPKENVFAYALFGFELASADRRFVAVNFVQPEDGATSMADYAPHMRMVGYLHQVYPKVHITLHAGELAPGLVPAEGLCCHIRLAVEQAYAERIGHGVDVMSETNPDQLLREMAARHVMVEVNLTSNDVILGVRGDEHPFSTYRNFRVPIALSTDDEGVSRIDLTHEYLRAAQTYRLPYHDLKQLARTSLEHAFLPGVSIWSEMDGFGVPVAVCSGDVLGAENPSGGCSAFLKSSERASEQWELERRFRLWEAQR